MFFVTKANQDYLVVKRNSRDNGITIGARSPETEAASAAFISERATVQETLKATELTLLELIRQYKALKLPRAMPKPVRVLRELDIANLLGHDFMVVGPTLLLLTNLKQVVALKG